MNINIEYYSVPEAAKLCGVGRTTMWRWVKTGDIKAFVTPGGHHRILKKDIDPFMTKRKNLELAKQKIVLLVEDDPFIQKVITKSLQYEKYRLEIANNGFEAGIKISAIKPDLIILDLFMQGVNGFDVCRMIKNNESLRHIKVLAITGFDTPENRENILSDGADGYLSKSAGPKTLIENIQQLLNI